MISMLLVDDEYLVRMGVKETIQWSEYGIEIVGEASDGEQGLELALQTRPDIILTDVRMPVVDGLEFIDNVRKQGLDSVFIILSGFEEFDYVRKALHNGAFAYLLKPIDNEQLIETVQKAVGRIKEERSTRHYYSRLKNELSSIKKQFLLDLALGNIKEKKDILEKIEFLDIPIETTNNFVVVIKVDDYQLIQRNFPAGELAEVRENITRHIAGLLLLNSDFMGTVVEKPEDEWIVLLHRIKTGEGVLEMVKRRSRELAERIESVTGRTVSIGISDVCPEIECTHSAYKEAHLAARHKILPGSSSIVYVRDIESSGYRREIREAIKYIKENYSKDITVEMAAKELFISASYLMHLFRDEVGKTFNECLTDYRIQIAKELLKNSRYRIYEVSECVGYGDVKYFSQIFKKVTGMTPSDYIRSEA